MKLDIIQLFHSVKDINCNNVKKAITNISYNTRNFFNCESQDYMTPERYQSENRMVIQSYKNGSTGGRDKSETNKRYTTFADHYHDQRGIPCTSLPVIIIIFFFVCVSKFHHGAARTLPVDRGRHDCNPGPVHHSHAVPS